MEHAPLSELVSPCEEVLLFYDSHLCIYIFYMISDLILTKEFTLYFYVSRYS